MSQAKTLAFLEENASNPADLNKLAVLLKQAGDLQGAKEALLKSKQVQSQQESTNEEEQVEYESPVNKACDEANLEELTTTTVSYNDDEMLDVETMADMKAAGMDIPSQQEYLDRAMLCKRKAVEAKQQGDLATAKKHLLHYKKFEKVIEQLFGQDGNINIDEEEDDEDYSLLDELYEGNGARQHSQDDGFFEQLFGAESTAVELEDLDDLDPSMLRDMMDSGMDVPNVEEVMALSAGKKAAAIQFKKSGNLMAAKAALEESKRLAGRAQQLSDMLKAVEAMNNGDNEGPVLDPEAALEAMLQAEEKPKQQQQPAAAPVKQEELKSAHEYKVQAVTFKKEGRLQEAATALRLYKQALANEMKIKVAAQRKECIAQLEEELKTAEEQSFKFSYYQRFVDKELGSAQLAVWNEYSRQCMAVIGALEKGGEPIEMQRVKTKNMAMIEGTDVSFIGRSIDPAEQRIEISILEIVDLQANKNLRLALNISNPDEKLDIPANDSIRVHVTVQLPPSAEAPDDSTELEYRPQPRVDGAFVFGPPQYANAERGSSRFAKLVARRINRKRITFDVYYESSKKGLFSRSTKETLLGTVPIKLQELLETNVIAGEFPLVDNKTGKKVLGGRARVAIRTGSAFAPDQETEEKPETGSGSTYAAMQYYAAYQLSN